MLLNERVCPSCRLSASVRDMKLMPKGQGTWMVCESCVQHLKEGKVPIVVKTDVSQTAAAARAFARGSRDVQETSSGTQELRSLRSPTIQQPAPVPQDVRFNYSCRRCEYDFTVKEGNLERGYTPQCPYCGKGDRVSKR